MGLVSVALTGLLAVLSPIAFTSVHRSTQSLVEEPREVAVRTPAEWQTLWKEHAPPSAKLPGVDFAKDMVVGVFLGTRPTGGYSVDVVSVESSGGETVVTYRETQPARDALLIQTLTSPVHLVRIPRQKGAVRFVRAQK